MNIFRVPHEHCLEKRKSIA